MREGLLNRAAFHKGDDLTKALAREPLAGDSRRFGESNLETQSFLLTLVLPAHDQHIALDFGEVQRSEEIVEGAELHCLNGSARLAIGCDKGDEAVPVGAVKPPNQLQAVRMEPDKLEYRTLLEEINHLRLTRSAAQPN